MLRRLPILALAALLGCAGTSHDEADAPRPVTPEMFKPLTEAYRDYVSLLNQLDSPSPKDRTDAMTKLQATPYGYFPDDRDLIAKAAARDESARRELVRRGRILDALFAFWGKVDLPKWNDARERIVALGQDARIILVNTLFRMLLNGQLQEQWPQIRFQLIAVGPDTFETAVALFRAKADQTPDAIIFRKDDLVQVALVILGFGEKGRPVIEEHAKSPRFNVRRAVAVALGEGRATEHLGVLEHLLKNDPEWMVRADAATAMGSIRDRAKAGAALVAALKVERDRNVRRHIAESLGTLVYADGVPTLVASLQVSDFEYGERAMFALFQITGERHLTADAWQKWFAKDYEKWKAKPHPGR
jgi:hypothetical protein